MLNPPALLAVPDSASGQVILGISVGPVYTLIVCGYGSPTADLLVRERAPRKMLMVHRSLPTIQVNL